MGITIKRSQLDQVLKSAAATGKAVFGEWGDGVLFRPDRGSRLSGDRLFDPNRSGMPYAGCSLDLLGTNVILAAEA